MKVRGDGDAFLLESVEGGERIGRYSFIGSRPMMTIVSRGDQVEIREAPPGDGARPRRVERRTADVLDVTRSLLRRHRPVPDPSLPRFAGGAVGYFGYDLVRSWERLPNRPVDDLSLPTCYLAVADTVVIFDHVRHTMKIVANAAVDGDGGAAYRRAVEKVEQLYERLRMPIVAVQGGGRIHPAMDTDMPVATFLGAVERAKEYIRAGDIFQVVLSRRFSAVVEDVDALDIYRALRTVNPSPYMFFLDFEDAKIIGSSPELLVRLEGGVVETRPLAGTRPRGDTDEDDRGLEAQLLADELEPVSRGPYAGAVGYLGFSGNMDTAITIRTIVMAGNRAYVQAGAGIVADSVPEREYVETVNKAKALVRALERVNRANQGTRERGNAGTRTP